MRNTAIFWICGLTIIGLPQKLNSIKFNFGNCPVYFEEPCSPYTTKFILSMGKGDNISYHDLDPYQPILPKYYNVLLPLKIVVHGYGGLGIDSATTNVTNAYQDIGYNIIIVEWEPLGSIPCYVTAYLNTWHVGQCLAIIALNLMTVGITPSLTHVVGFSLGAHVAGFAGAIVKNTIGFPFMRITGE